MVYLCSCCGSYILSEAERIISVEFLKLVLAKHILMCYYFNAGCGTSPSLLRHHFAVYAIHNQLFFTFLSTHGRFFSLQGSSEKDQW
jgi:hypothetical protein